MADEGLNIAGSSAYLFGLMFLLTLPYSVSNLMFSPFPLQIKEISNGRLAMIGFAGMVAQELVTGAKLF